ncbi:hypothetical protein LCGC14_2198460 [marine sediment metagenome]|uniref:TATA-box-binding protein n=1 Tax=marine sediment metagenome TaxID=412755 RepID=A0A0F9DHK3_9ZZZZ
MKKLLLYSCLTIFSVSIFAQTTIDNGIINLSLSAPGLKVADTAAMLKNYVLTGSDNHDKFSDYVEGEHIHHSTVTSTGTKSVVQVKKVIQAVIKQLKKINVNITIKPKITVQNIVASGTINLKLNLNFLALEMENTEYEPEQFPGLVYKLIEPNATFLLFSNGKLVCTGTKNKQQLEYSMVKLLKNVKAVLKNYKK